jgi:uncharacterized protein with ParB-like and HNH nuclease domain
MEAQKKTLYELLISEGKPAFYSIPKYQRSYTWKKDNWETLFDDIIENGIGHFMGTIICVLKNSDKGDNYQDYDVIDGQQRLTTLSILLMALYKRSQELLKSGGYQKKLSKLSASLEDNIIIQKEKSSFGDYLSDPKDNEGKYKYLRVTPSTQDSNLEDYTYLIKSELNLIVKDITAPPYHSNRRIKKVFDYFTTRIEKLEEVSFNFASELSALISKVNSINLIQVTAESSSDAFIMFETINNRGVPLSPVDIIKSKILADLEKTSKTTIIAESFKYWKKIIENLEDSAKQIRFLRQYYNGFQYLKDDNGKERIKVGTRTKASKTNLIGTYSEIITRDPNWLLQELIKKSETYKNLTEAISDDENLEKALFDLANVKAASAYTSLLVLKDYAQISNEALIEIIEIYINFFIRRNITDSPPTRDLDTIQVNISEEIFKKVEAKEQGTINGQWLYEQLKKHIKISSLEFFKEKLNGSLYDDNKDMTRFLLIKMEEKDRSREQKKDFWEKTKKGQYIWTIEHVFPKGDTIPNKWVEMIADGHAEEAEKIKQDYVHKLGNLTMSGYNSRLSAKDFGTKQLHELDNGKGTTFKIGYQNGLNLNDLKFEVDGELFALSNAEKWDKEHIEARGNQLIQTILEYFKFDDESVD